jgi:hypothetical protein
MDEFLQSQVIALLAQFRSRRLCEILDELIVSHSLSPNFDLIQEKLNANLYISLFDFSLDVRSLLLDAKSATQDRFTIAAVADLSAWFEAHVHRVPRTPDELFHSRLTHVQKRLHTLRRAMSLSASSATTDLVDKSQLPPPKVSKQAPATLINEIQELLAGGSTPVLQLRILSILKRHIPAFSPAERVSLSSADISLLCAEELRDVLKQYREEKKTVIIEPRARPGETGRAEVLGAEDGAEKPAEEKEKTSTIGSRHRQGEARRVEVLIVEDGVQRPADEQERTGRK